MTHEGSKKAMSMTIPSQSSVLQALITVATRSGIEINAEQLQRRFALNGYILATDTLVAIARDLGMEAKVLHLSFTELPRLAKALPAILRAKDGGALILEGARADPMMGAVAIIRDPSAPDDEQFAIEEVRLADIWQGEVILVKRMHQSGDENQPFGLAWLGAQVLRERKLFGDIAAGALVNTAFTLAPPFIFMVVLDRVLTGHSFSTLNVIVGVILIMLVFETILGYLRRVLTQVATTRIDGRLNLYIVEKLLKLPMDYFERNPTGKTLGKLGQIWLIRNFLTGQLFGAFLDAVPLLGLIPAMLILDWRLSLMAFVLSGIIFLIVLAFMKPMARRHKRVTEAETLKGSHLVETIYGIKTIKSLALEGRRRKEWDRKVAEATAARHDLGLMANYPQTLSLPFERLIYSGCFAVGAYMILAKPDSMNPGALVAFSMLSMRLAAPLVKVANLQMDIAEVRAAISEVASIVNVPPEESRSNGLRLAIKGEVTFNDVHLRTHIGVVPQENFLFSGTIRENISMARGDASFQEIVRAAQLSGAEEFIERLPRGYDTILEEGATNLSGGQRQRLAIARALLINPPVLILDEATSALDAESEAIVNANLKRMAKGRTVISISHRLSMLVEADAILVLERGKVYDLGTHEELLQRCDIYKQMWYQQNRHLDQRAPDLPRVISGTIR